VSLGTPDYYPARIAAFAKKSDFTALYYGQRERPIIFGNRSTRTVPAGIPLFSFYINNATN